MSGESFASPTDLATYLRRDVDTASAEMLLGQASAEIRGICGWDIDAATQTVTLDSDGGRLLFLPAMQVSDVTAVLANDTTLPVGSYTWSALGMLARRDGACWPSGLRVVTVTFTAGYDPVPASVQRLCLRMAAAGLAHPDGASAVRLGSLSLTYGHSGSDDEDPDVVLTRYRLPASA